MAQHLGGWISPRIHALDVVAESKTPNGQGKTVGTCCLLASPRLVEVVVGGSPPAMMGSSLPTLYSHELGLNHRVKIL